MKSFIRFALVFLLLYWLFKKMLVLVHVNMTGWQFIVFVVTLVAVVEYLLERWDKRRGY